MGHHKINVRFDKKTLAQLRAIRKRSGVPIQWIVSRAVARFLREGLDNETNDQAEGRQR